MHDAEKSDPPRVPRKSANNAACAASEPMEGRGETKGNADPQSTVRTQSRDLVALDRTFLCEECAHVVDEAAGDSRTEGSVVCGSSRASRARHTRAQSRPEPRSQ